MALHIVSIACLVLVLAAATFAQYPEGCACPEECDCIVRTGRINCNSRGLTYVPTEINSCAWPGIRSIDLSGNAITTVNALAFSQLANLTQLFLFDNAIRTIHPNAFEGLVSLEFLFLDGNRIEELHYTVFEPLGNLQRLLLYSNHLTSLPAGVFSEQSKLTVLALYSNQLTSLSPDIFTGLTLLDQLYLHENNLTDLSNSPFHLLSRLRLLYLNNNQLNRLSRFAFLGLAQLLTLVLNNNGLSQLGEETFNPLINLRDMYLDNNRLTYISRLHFAGLVQLVNLRASYNLVTSVSEGAFFRLRNLQQLHLFGNQITTVTRHTFVGLDSLRELALYNNRITHIKNSSFVQSPLLERLWLNSNRISCLEPDAFRGLSNLQLLQLGDNDLSFLPEEVFQQSPNLLYLLLYNNQFRTIGNRPFRNLQRLIQLSIYFNSIEYLAEGCLAGTDQLFYFQWNVERNFTTDNRLVCDCSSQWLYNWMSSRPLQSSMYCGQPEQFQGQDIRSLQLASFGCNSVSLRVEAGPQCEDHVVQRGGCLRLECYSSPRAPVQWTRVDGRQIRTVPVSCGSGEVCSGGGDGVLVVENVKSDDTGYYLCTATTQGVAASHVCKVTVGEPPLLLEEPEELYLTSPGLPAKFHLNFTGTPLPTVTWYHSNSSTGRMVHIEETGPNCRYAVSQLGTLVILETRLEDEGVFTAVISNGVGEVRAETRLEFFFSTPCRQSCQNNGRCVAYHSCICPEQYEGRFCDIYNGPPTPLVPAGSGSGESLIDDEDYPLNADLEKRSVHNGRARPSIQRVLRELDIEETAFETKLQLAKELARAKKQQARERKNTEKSQLQHTTYKDQLQEETDTIPLKAHQAAVAIPKTNEEANPASLVLGAKSMLQDSLLPSLESPFTGKYLHSNHDGPVILPSREDFHQSKEE